MKSQGILFLTDVGHMNKYTCKNEMSDNQGSHQDSEKRSLKAIFSIKESHNAYLHLIRTLITP